MRLLDKISSGYPFGRDDVVQQALGSSILTAPFLFTEEVWTLASNISSLQASLLAGFALALGHGVLYVASGERDWGAERKFLGITWRYISLMAVSFGTIAGLIALTSPVETFGATLPQTLKTVAMVSVFSVVGAATADNLV